jgi:hypothetical protein
MPPILRLFINNQKPVSMDLIDSNEILFRDVKGGAEDLPVFQQVFFSVTRTRTKVEIGQLSLACAAPSGAKRVGYKIAPAKC